MSLDYLIQYCCRISLNGIAILMSCRGVQKLKSVRSVYNQGQYMCTAELITLFLMILMILNDFYDFRLFSMTFQDSDETSIKMGLIY